MCDEGRTDLCCVSSGVTFEETTYACPAEPGAGGPGDDVSLWTTGPPHQGTDAAGRMHHFTDISRSHRFGCHRAISFMHLILC